MSILTTAGAPPAFFTASYFRKDCDTQSQVVATSMQGIAYRLYQMDPTAQWVGSLGADDTKTERVTIGLYAGTLLTARMLDSVFLLNHNLNNFLIEYCTDYVAGTGGAAGTGTWQTLVNVTGQAGADYFFQLGSPISPNGLRLTMTTTSPANQQKALGNFIACLAKLQLGASSTPVMSMMKFESTPKQTFAEVVYADKTKARTYFYWSDNSFVLNDLDFEFDLMSDADRKSLENFITGAATGVEPFICWPEPGDQARNVYLCQFVPGVYRAGYSISYKQAGRKFSLRLEQVGFL